MIVGEGETVDNRLVKILIVDYELNRSFHSSR